MAPSRALLRRIASVQPPRSTPRLLPPSHRISIRPQCYPALRSGPSRHFPALLCSYATAVAVAPEPPDHLSEGELHVFKKIREELQPVRLEVQDISGGCGSMYALEIESPKFKGLSVIKQHKLVNEVLKEEIAGWHGVQLRTKPS